MSAYKYRGHFVTTSCKGIKISTLYSFVNFYKNIELLSNIVLLPLKGLGGFGNY